MKKKIIIVLIIIGLICMFFGYKLFSKNNLIRIDYNSIVEKTKNKESFVLCVSRTNCSHCLDYKPKLKKVAGKYDIKIYYIDIDTATDKEEKQFKDNYSFDGGTPVTIFFKNGEEKTTATRIEGDVSEEIIINKLKKNGFIK